MEETRQVTRLQAKPKISSRRPAVECARGHLNDPYPENGQCIECSLFLPANPYALTSEMMPEINRRKAEGGKSRDEIARDVLEDEGIEWDEATEGMRQLALLFAKSKNTKTLELIYQQIGVLKAKPKPGEENPELTYEVVLTGANVGDLQRSLADLDDLLRIGKA